MIPCASPRCVLSSNTVPLAQAFTDDADAQLRVTASVQDRLRPRARKLRGQLFRRCLSLLRPCGL